MGTETDTEKTAAPDTQVSTTHTVIACVLLFIGVFSVSWLATVGWQNRVYIADLFYQSSLEKFNVASGQSGPATFRVFHSDFEALEALSLANDEILGVEMTANRGIAAMAFITHDSPAIGTVRDHPSVKNMLRKNIPMLCH